MSRTLCLSGMMGAGKTTVAEILGRRLGRSVVDTDREIERWTGRSVADVFAEGGEEAFRELERRVVVEIARVPDLVVALGGGTVLRDDTVADLLLSGVIVHLDVPVGVLADRLAPQREQRPMLQPGPDAPPLHEVVEGVLAARRTRYADVADLIVDGARDAEDVAEDIIAWTMEASDVLTPSELEQVMT
jgi:shikimate kinase